MDVEELVILEAIRLSLLDNQQQASHRDGQSDDETGSDDDQAGAANLASDDDEAGASHLGRAGVASDYEHSHSQVSESEDGDALAGQENQEDFEEAWPAVSWAVEHSQEFENTSRSTLDAAASSASVGEVVAPATDGTEMIRTASTSLSSSEHVSGRAEGTTASWRRELY